MARLLEQKIPFRFPRKFYCSMHLLYSNFRKRISSFQSKIKNDPRLTRFKNQDSPTTKVKTNYDPQEEVKDIQEGKHNKVLKFYFLKNIVGKIKKVNNLFKTKI